VTLILGNSKGAMISSRSSSDEEDELDEELEEDEEPLKK
jgi:hypothetical protein